MIVNLDFLEGLSDPYIKDHCGKGYLLAGVILGRLAWYQARKRGSDGETANEEGTVDEVENMPVDLTSSPIFKQLSLGRLDKYSLKKHLSRVPKLIGDYGVHDSNRMLALLGKIMELLMMCDSDMGVDGNFAFTLGFVKWWEYYGKIFSLNTRGGE